MEWIRRPLGPAARSQLSRSKALGLPGSPESINRRPAFSGLHFGAGKLTVCDRLGAARPRPSSLPPPPPTKGALWSVGPAGRQLLPPRGRCRLVWKARGGFEVKRSARDWGLPPPAHPKPSGLQPAAASPAAQRPLGLFAAPPAPSSAGDPGGLCEPDGPHIGGGGYGQSLPDAPAPGRPCPGWVERRRSGGGSGRVNLCASLKFVGRPTL